MNIADSELSTRAQPSPAMNYPAIITPLPFAKPHPKIQATSYALASSRMGTLSDASEQGPNTSGPIANARTKIVSASLASSSLIPRDEATASRAGAIVAPEIRVTRPSMERRTVRTHFRQ